MLLYSYQLLLQSFILLIHLSQLLLMLLFQ